MAGRIAPIPGLFLITSVVALGVRPTRALGQQFPSIQEIGALAAPPAKEALRGALSPDGRLFAYEVVEQDERQIWLMDIATKKVRALTSTPGVRYGPAWSPNGSMIAYNRTQPYSREDERDDGLWVLDSRTGAERKVFPASLMGKGVLESLSWASDTTLVFWTRLDGSEFGDVMEKREGWLVGLQGSLLKRGLLVAEGEYAVLSPDGRWVATLGTCCGGREPALLVRAIGDSSARCLAGPLRVIGEPSLSWAPDAHSLFFLSESPVDSTAHAFWIHLLDNKTWTAAEHIGPLLDPVTSVSAGRDGKVAVVVRPDSGRLGRLWIVSRSSRGRPGETRGLETCRGPRAPIMALVQRSQLPKVRDINLVLEIPEQRLTVFRVSYGREQDWGLYQSAIGLLYRDRIGWIVAERSGYTSSEADSVQRGTEWFPLRSDDTLLMSGEFLARLEKAGLARAFREFLGRHPETPPGVLRRLVREDPGGNAVAQNQRLSDPTTSWKDLITLAALSPAVAQVVLKRPDVRSNPERVYAITQLPEYRGSGEMQWGVLQQFRTFAPLLLSYPDTPEPLLIELFYSIRGRSDDTGAMRALYEHRGTRHSATLMTLFASEFTPNPRDTRALAVRARERLPGFGLETVEEAKRALVRRVRADTTLPAFTFRHAVSLAGLDWRLLQELYRIRGRDSASERNVRESLAGSQAPLPILRELAESLRTDPQYGIASSLLRNYSAQRDAYILKIIAGLDTARARNLPAWADSLLRQQRKESNH